MKKEEVHNVMPTGRCLGNSGIQMLSVSQILRAGHLHNRLNYQTVNKDKTLAC